MKAHIGIDIIEIRRIREAIVRHGERFLKRIYTDAELELYQDKPQSLSARFAAKEAVMKALSKPGAVIGWKEIEVLSDTEGKPLVNLYGLAKELAAEAGLSGIEISLSHTRENAVALVFGIREV